MQRACAKWGFAAHICADPSRLRRAKTALSFPGLGRRAAPWPPLITGLGEALRQRLGRGVPVLGICSPITNIPRPLGRRGHADPWPSGRRNARFQFADPALKVPHMGWNTQAFASPILCFRTCGRTMPSTSSTVISPCPGSRGGAAEVTYEQPFCCALGKDSYVGVQFHTRNQTGGACLALALRRLGRGFCPRRRGGQPC